jgi:phosphate-selective porin OprO and OprP
MTALRSKLPAIFLGIVCSIQMATVTVADSRNVELYFDPDSKQIATEPGKNTIKLNTLQPIEDLEQKKQELISIENRLNAKLKALDDKLKQLEQLESAAPAAGISPAKAAPAAQAPAQVQDTKQPVGTTASQPASKFPVSASYGDKGFELMTDDGRFALQIQNRLQFRYVNPFDTDPRSFQDLAQDQSSFMVRRARFRVNGHAFRPWLRYAMQYDWSQPVMRDFYLDIAKFPWAQLRIGRAKVLWNDERVTSSGRQQLANRSIVNDIFTVDRQQGVQVFGRAFPGQWYDFSYAAGIFTGLGVGERHNDDNNMMYAGRLQWNFLGDELPFSQSDLEYHEKPAASLAFAAATDRSKCTAFETDSTSCRALPGFAIGKPGQFRLNQAMQEFRFKWRGFSLQNEFHWKQVIDTLKIGENPTRKTDLLGAYIQAGYFPHYLIKAVPRQLEFAVRYALVNPDIDRSNDLQREVSAAVNWFFSGHANKLTFDFSHLSVEDPVLLMEQSEQRARVQWDISF